MNDLSFVQGWYERGKNESDIVFKFVSYFVAFNFLYGGSNGSGDKAKMKGYVQTAVSPLYPNDTVFDLLTSDTEFYKQGFTTPALRDRLVKLENRTTLTLFCAIYQVRCNLFHGSKTMESERDQGLVTDGSKVLEDFLGKWIKNNGGECDA